jgi:hypothetical protein
MALCRAVNRSKSAPKDPMLRTPIRFTQILRRPGVAAFSAGAHPITFVEGKQSIA